MREFGTGAVRDAEDGKFDYEGFLSPLVLEAYAAYMNKHRKQADGNLRDSDNWQKGIPLPVYMKSLWRHVVTAWKIHRGLACVDERDGHKITIEEALCGILFNTFGYMHETLKVKWLEPQARRTVDGPWTASSTSVGAQHDKACQLPTQPIRPSVRDGILAMELRWARAQAKPGSPTRLLLGVEAYKQFHQELRNDCALYVRADGDPKFIETYNGMKVEVTNEITAWGIVVLGDKEALTKDIRLTAILWVRGCVDAFTEVSKV